ncbi:phosphatidylglycerophosphatase A [Alphaproteobacteria bacterium]|nr:phosphatidylglycerophosphatase A [Alphaproteobacteria bacterium]
MSVMDKLLQAIATLGPIGKLPAPGTAGSVVAVIIGLYLMSFGPLILGFGCLIVLVIGTIASEHYTRITGRKDPSEVIIDEVAGQWSVLLCIPYGTPDMLIWVGAGFLLFRFFDIVKPPPVSTAEALPGGIGIMADDMVAGTLAGICLLILSYLTGTPLF